MINQECKLHTVECKCLSWRPIFAGALIAIGLSFLLNLFSVAISLTAFTADSQGVENLAVGGLIATAIGIIASMFASGWLAGYLSSRHCTKRHLGALYGFLTWVVALLVAIFFADHMQHYITLYSHSLSGTPVITASLNQAGEMQAVATRTQENSIVISSYIIFILFFLSAFACSLGGHCGMRYICKDEIK